MIPKEKWLSITGFPTPLTIASRMDPMSPLTIDLTLYLKLQTLLWGTLLIPETHLLNNPSFADYLMNDTFAKEMEEFFYYAHPIITRNDHDWNESFEAHWEKSKSTRNPFLVEGEAGKKHARFLDNVISDENCKYYDSERAGSFEDLFKESLYNIFEEKALRTEGVSKLEDFLFHRDRIIDTEEIRGKIDGFQGLSRGRVFACLDHLTADPHLRSFRPYVEEAARQAYTINILKSLNRDVNNSAVVPLLTKKQLTSTPGYELTSDEDTIKYFVKKSKDLNKLYNIDPETVRNTSWEDIVNLSKNSNREEFQKLRSSLTKQNNLEVNSTIESMIEVLDDYLSTISDGLKGKNFLQLQLKQYYKPSKVIGVLSLGLLIGLVFDNLIKEAVVSTVIACTKPILKKKIDERRKDERGQRLQDYLIKDKRRTQDYLISC